MFCLRLLVAVFLLVVCAPAAVVAENEGGVICPNCKATSPGPRIMGIAVPARYHALDGRPDRELYESWVCPVCAYACPECAWSPRQGPVDPREIAAMHSSAYQAIVGGLYPEQSRNLLLAAHLARARGDLLGSADLTLRAVWACVDCIPSFGVDGVEFSPEERMEPSCPRPLTETETAQMAICRDLRERAATRFEQALVPFPVAGDEYTRMYKSVILVDLYRRVGAFAKADALCSVLLRQAQKGYPAPRDMHLTGYAGNSERNLFRDILQYQQTLIARKDTREHRIGAWETPAQVSSAPAQ